MTKRASGRAIVANEAGPATQASASDKAAGRGADSNAGSDAQKRPVLEEKTDLARWRMLDESGRQTWHYVESDEAAQKWPQSYADKWYLGLDLVSQGECRRVSGPSSSRTDDGAPT